jgi:hypothetical protein
VKKPKWAKLRKPHGKTSARSFTGAEVAEIAADKAEQSSKVSHKQPGREDTPESSGADEIIIPKTPERAGKSQGGTTITLALKTPERLRAGPDLTHHPSSLSLHGSCRPRRRPQVLARPRHAQNGNARAQLDTEKAERMGIQRLLALTSLECSYP